ncbi:MAG: hypothetical protein PHU85_14930 [Phycisphaerae bacterium]|nr:hypothetical protein [Phycisphaerae bacterium]
MADLRQNGIYLSIGQLAGLSAIWYRGAIASSVVGAEQAQLKAAWVELSNWNLRQEYGRDGIPRLVVDKQANAGAQTKRSELLGIGVGLAVGMKLYDIDYPSWDVTHRNERHDLFAYHPASHRLVKVEAKGRYMRQNLKAAITQVYRKFAVADFAHAAGVVFAPRHTPNPRTADIVLIDPTGNHEPNDQYVVPRALLSHYTPFFRRQGRIFDRFAARLQEIRTFDHRRFLAYLREGDAVLADLAATRSAGRTTVRVRGHLFRGTAWEGFVWPAHLTGLGQRLHEGVFYWGLWEEVINALIQGKLHDVLNMRVRPCVSRLGNKALVVLPDGSALAWAPNPNELTPSMFDDLE